MPDAPDQSEGEGHLQSEVVRTGFIRGITKSDKFMIKQVEYSAVDGEAIFEGDMILGTLAEMDTLVQQVEATPGETLDAKLEFLADFEQQGLTVLDRYLWPLGRVPYVIADDLPDQSRVTKAIAHWEEKTDIEFVERTAERDYVLFRRGSGCSAHVGRTGKQQIVALGSGCSLGNTIHEIGHALGLWHEQCRSDRDTHIEVKLENVSFNARHNFTQKLHNGVDRGAYDLGSIMHYGTHYFSKNGQPTIVVKNGASIGQRDGLSAGDIAAIAEAYADEYAKR